MAHYPVWEDFERCLNAIPNDDRNKNELHPGLILDRYVAYPEADSDFGSFDQRCQKTNIETITKCNGAWKQKEDIAKAILKNGPFGWNKSSNVLQWTQTTIWRMALHLSRASGLENGSICLHPLYGFPFLPGSGLKGMARAYAHVMEDKKEDHADVKRILGAPDSGVGNVIFFDAWPTQWVNIEMDIVNNHHEEYYNKKCTRRGILRAPSSST